MKTKSIKPETIRYGEVKQVRLTTEMNNQLKAKALEQNTTESEVIRQAIIFYINRNLSDTEIVHASINNITRRVQTMSDKVELLALIVMQQTKHWMRILPNIPNNSEEITEVNFSDFQKNCMKTLKRNHIGMLESMLLDFYESGVGTEDDNR